MLSILACWLAAYLALAVHLGVVAVAGRGLGAQVEEVRFSTLGGWVAREAAPRVCVGWLPGGYVRFVGAGDKAAEGYERLAAWRRAVIPLCGPVAVLALAAALLGPDAAVASALRAPGQLLAGLRPWSAAPAVLDACTALLQRPALTIVGVLCSKVAAFNLLPLPPLALGQALLALLPLPEKVGVGLNIAGLLASAALFVGWAVAVVAYLAP